MYSMIPIGKQMAEALLSESDESTASLYDTSPEKEVVEHFSPSHFNHSKVPSNVTRSADHGKWSFRSETNSLPGLPSGGGPRHSSKSTSSRRNIMKLCTSSRYVALDCEMVGVGPGGKRSVLARVSIVDYYGKCLLDTFVSVQEKVTDYRTHVTGISEKDLSSKTALSFGECRFKAIKVIRNKILVGHGLENDLSVLGITHPWVNIRDTCHYYPYQKMDRFGRACPRRLRDLARSYLRLIIQKDDRPHCPVEDACAAMALYRHCQMDWDHLVDTYRQDLALRGSHHGALCA